MKKFLLLLLIVICNCNVFSQNWTLLNRTPLAREGASMVPIGESGLALVFGGIDMTSYSNETWIYDKSKDSWTQVSSKAGLQPSGRYNQAMDYIGNGKVLLFGGNTSTGENGETWIFDLADSSWTQQFPTGDISPSPRFYHTLCKISAGKVLLFGGLTSNNVNRETWIYDVKSNSWCEMAPIGDTLPTARKGHAMCYITEGKAFMFAGNNKQRSNNEVWIYDLKLNTWTLQNLAHCTNPSARSYHAVSYIADSTVIMFGGHDGVLDDETWIYSLNHNEWYNIQPKNQIMPSARKFQSMCYFGADSVLLWGGVSYIYEDDLWIYDLSEKQWSTFVPNNTQRPSPRVHNAACYSGNEKIVMFGGNAINKRSNETWIYDLKSGDWELASPVGNVKPSVRERQAMSYIGDDKLILFGGQIGATDFGKPNNETWIYDLSDNTWEQKTPAGVISPKNREEHAMCYIGDDKVVTFGGINTFQNTNETWIYDLSDNQWAIVEQSNKVKPYSMAMHSMSYIGDDKIILISGVRYENDTLKYLNSDLFQTWMYDLSDNQWTKLNIKNNKIPKARYLSSLSYLGNNKLLMFGGLCDEAVNDNWIFDLTDTSWTKITTSVKPYPKVCHAASGFNGNGKVLLVGGESVFGSSKGTSDYWLFEMSDSTSTVAVNEAQSPHSLSIYPMPAKDYINIALDSAGDYYSIEIYSSEGKLVKTIHNDYSNFGSMNATINIADLPTGTYLLRVISHSNVANGKFEVMR